MHTDFDDGSDSAEKMIEAAMKAGLRSVGISVHSPLPYKNDWTVNKEDIPEYLKKMDYLKKKYLGKIEIFTGTELDAVSEMPLSGFDYAIGSVHHIPKCGRYLSVDESEKITSQLLKKYYGGDGDAAARDYFAEYEKIAGNDGVSIVGHFDLITKYNDICTFFDADSELYKNSALSAMEKLVKAGKIFEINTGAISCGYRKTPYPSEFLIKSLKEMGGRVTVSSDSHSAKTVAFGLEEAAGLAKKCGFEEIYILTPYGFEPQRI